jgi:hypothetical protein
MLDNGNAGPIVPHSEHQRRRRTLRAEGNVDAGGCRSRPARHHGRALNPTADRRLKSRFALGSYPLWASYFDRKFDGWDKTG